MLETTMALTVEEDVVHTEVNQHTMLVSIADGKYYSLSPVGTRIWQLLENPITQAELVERLRADFEVSLEECQADVASFVEQLKERRLVRQA
jgi:hypothetical protein